jgi:hypothetical protein
MTDVIRQEIDKEMDMIKGNLNRMCVTDDTDELLTMYAYASIRLNDLLRANRNRIFRKKYPVMLQRKEDK